MNMNLFFKSVLLTLFLSICCSTYAKSDLVRDIILINGIAELAEFTTDGEVVQRYGIIDDYFSSGKSHKKNLRESLDKLKLFGSAVEPRKQKKYSMPTVCRQSLLAAIEDENHEGTYQDNWQVLTVDIKSEMGYKNLALLSYSGTDGSILMSQPVTDSNVKNLYLHHTRPLRRRIMYEKTIAFRDS